MSLRKINDEFIDVKKISYIGKLDTHVKPHINITIPFFLIIVDGHSVEISSTTRHETEILRQSLIDIVNAIEGYLPG